MDLLDTMLVGKVAIAMGRMTVFRLSYLWTFSCPSKVSEGDLTIATIAQ